MAEGKVRELWGKRMAWGRTVCEGYKLHSRGKSVPRRPSKASGWAERRAKKRKTQRKLKKQRGMWQTRKNSKRGIDSLIKANIERQLKKHKGTRQRRKKLKNRDRKLEKSSHKKKFKNEGMKGGKKLKNQDNKLNKWRHKENWRIERVPNRQERIQK